MGFWGFGVLGMGEAYVARDVELADVAAFLDGELSR